MDKKDIMILFNDALARAIRDKSPDVVLELWSPVKRQWELTDEQRESMQRLMLAVRNCIRESGAGGGKTGRLREDSV